MDEQVRELRAKVSRVQQGRPPTAVRYPVTIRRRVTALARRRQAGGADVTAIAREIGVAPWTLALWLRRPRRAVMRTVDVVPDAPRATDAAGSGPVVITPQGLRVEGLDREGLVAVLRALG
jgi:transposase-like protein